MRKTRAAGAEGRVVIGPRCVWSKVVVRMQPGIEHGDVVIEFVRRLAQDGGPDGIDRFRGLAGGDAELRGDEADHVCRHGRASTTGALQHQPLR